MALVLSFQHRSKGINYDKYEHARLTNLIADGNQGVYETEFVGKIIHVQESWTNPYGKNSVFIGYQLPFCKPVYLFECVLDADDTKCVVGNSIHIKGSVNLTDATSIPQMFLVKYPCIVDD
jgi:hypothetical protein